MIVSFSGIDGSGKTSHARALQEDLTLANVKSDLFWYRFGSAGRRSSSRGNAPRPDNVTNTGVTAASLIRRRRRLQNPLLRVGWLFFHLIRTIIMFTLRVRIPRWFGRVVLCDRYIWDAIVEIYASLGENSPLARFARWALLAFCPRPDIAWLLDVDPSVGIERQPDEDNDTNSFIELSKQHDQFLALAARYSMKKVVSQSSLEQTASLVVYETLRYYYHDYHTFMLGLLLTNPNRLNPRFTSLHHKHMN